MREHRSARRHELGAQLRVRGGSQRYRRSGEKILKAALFFSPSNKFQLGKKSKLSCFLRDAPYRLAYFGELMLELVTEYSRAT